MDTLSSQAAEWSFTHVQRFGDTDIFPFPFEYNAIKHSWKAIKDAIVKMDLGAYRVRPHRRQLVPKPDGGFRVAIQLDPIDTLVFTAFVYEAADAIERSRVPAERHVACSYRIQLDVKGTFFGADNGWKDFHSRSEEMCRSGKYSHVLIADVADFYNQTNHHRIQNALESAGVGDERSRNIEAFLMQLTAKQSRGVPVGPAASILLAEACLNDVDGFLLRKGTPHARYVDDFRIFCCSRREAVRTLHDLTEYLYTAHRLSLQSFKTRVVDVNEFTQKELLDPGEEEERGRVNRLQDLIREITEVTGYVLESEEELGPDMVVEAVRDNLVELFLHCLEGRSFNLGLARYLLRRAKALQTSALVPIIFAHMENLTPVMRDVALYLVSRAGRTECTREQRGPQLLKFLRDSDYGRLPFVKCWGLRVLANIPGLVTDTEALTLAEESAAILGVRETALLARQYKLVDWVRTYKETWNNHGPWDRRAIIWSASILPPDERRAWLDLVREGGELLDRAVADFAGIQVP